MSNVLFRMQGISEMEFYRNAVKLRTVMSAFLMRDKVVPKKWRYQITNKALDHVSCMIECMHLANRIYPYTPAEVERRRALQDRCLEYCDLIGEVMQNGIDNVWWQKLHAVNAEGEPTQERIKLENHLLPHQRNFRSHQDGR